MGTAYLVRHGQASFGADNYDKLSELGHRQALRLGEYFRQKGLKFDVVLVGTLTRHLETLAGIAEGMQWAPEAISWPGLNEYDSHAVISSVHPQPLPRAETPEMVKHHFRILRQGLSAWMAGSTQPDGMPSYVDFKSGVVGALDLLRLEHHGKNALVVSSGGPISTAVGQVLGMQPDATIELNLRIRNTSVTELAFTPKRHMLLTYNTLPHLDDAEHAPWVTYA